MAKAKVDFKGNGIKIDVSFPKSPELRTLWNAMKEARKADSVAYKASQAKNKTLEKEAAFRAAFLVKGRAEGLTTPTGDFAYGDRFDDLTVVPTDGTVTVGRKGGLAI